MLGGDPVGPSRGAVPAAAEADLPGSPDPEGQAPCSAAVAGSVCGPGR